MLSIQEIELVAFKSRIWTGPNSWGYVNGYRLNIQEAIKSPGFG